MLEKLDLTQKLEKEAYKGKMEVMETKLGNLQREYKELGIPVMIVYEGFGASGKGVQIGKLIQSLDPRGFHVYAIGPETQEEAMHPFLWRFWRKTPEKGRISIFDGSWYRKVLIDRFDKMVSSKQSFLAYESIRAFEHQLTDDGMVLIKIFLTIDQKEQKRRFDKLMKSEETAWRVSKGDLKRNHKFADYTGMIEDMLQKTDTDFAPWNLIEATDKRFATAKCYAVVIGALEEGLRKYKEKCAEVSTETEEHTDVEEGELKKSVLGQADLTHSYTKEEYQKKLNKLQSKIERLHGEVYQKRIPVVLALEGWDAGGKGGAIKRLTEKMDPRGFVVYPTAAPNDIERAHHYLWRFWKDMPKAGHIAIFDRTWYGRVMVERIEGFCTKKEWQRAYKEITDMERDLVNAGAVVLKFWMQIDKEEQERRFRDRQANPDKQWKITGEDWRNREKWDKYEVAVDEMLIRTSTDKAPWIVVEGNCKYYARIKVLETVIEAIEKKLDSK